MTTAMKAVTDAQQKLADRAVNVARGLESIGGVTKVTGDELNALSRTVTKGLDAFRALGQEAPSELTRVSKAITGQQEALKATSASWDSFVKNFNIQSAISNPMATAKSAVLAFSESVGGVALGAVAAVTAIAAVGAAAYKLAVNAAAVGSNLDDMADKTGMSVPALSRLQNAAKVAGADLGTLTNAVFMIEQRMGEGGKKWDDALAKMSLSTEDLRAAGPDRLLEVVSAGLAGIKDPAERAAAGAALMGKGFKDVVPILADLDAAFALTNDIKPWTAEQAQQAEQFEMRIASIIVHAKAFGEAIGRWLIGPIGTFVGLAVDVGQAVGKIAGELSGILPLIRGIGNAWEFGAAAIRKFRGEAEKLPKVTGDAAAGVAKWHKSVAAMTATVPDLNAALLEEEFATKALAADYAELTKAQASSDASHKKAADATRKAAEELLRNTDAVRKLEGAFFGLTTSVAAFDTTELDAVKASVALRTKIDEIERSAHVAIFGFKGMSEGLQAVGQKVDLVAPKLASMTLGDSLFKSLSALPGMFQEAFLGGGGVAGALKAIAVQLGVDFGKTMMDAIKKSVAAGSNAFNAVTVKAAAATGAVAGLGAAMSGASGKASAASAAMAGVSIAAGAIGTGATIGGAVALGAATAGIGLAAVGAYFALKKMLSDPEKKINPIREQFVQLHGGLAALNIQAQAAGVSLTAMLNARTPEAYNKAINELNAALDSQAADIAGLDEAIQRYGFSIEELGPAMQRQMLDEQAKTLLNDWRLLIGSGIELTTVNAKMASSMNDYLATARLTGMEVPASMQPILQSMIEQGLLTDAAGNKVENLEAIGVTFSQTMTQGFDRIVGKLEELLVKINLVPAAIAKIPTNISTTVDVNLNGHWNIPDIQHDFAAHGGLVTTHGIVQQFAAGGTVLPFRRRGSDSVPAMLTPGEIILNEAQQANVARAMSGGPAAVDNTPELQAIHAELALQRRLLPKLLRDAVLIAKVS